jgi:competence protein CoiA
MKFFAHKSRAPCQTAPETEAHLALKTLAAQAARRAGWKSSTEERGSSPSGETWTADVLAYRGEAKIAIEIQWSPQTNQESLNRQERYRQSDVRCLWLFRRSGFPASKDFPSARVSGDLTKGYKVHLGEQVMPLDEFLDAVFAKRFRYGIPLGVRASVRIHGWRDYLKREVVPVIRFIDVCVGPHRIRLTVPTLREAFPDLLAFCEERIPKAPSIDRKPNHNKLHIEEATLAEFQITISEPWVKATASICGWRVFAFE